MRFHQYISLFIVLSLAIVLVSCGSGSSLENSSKNRYGVVSGQVNYRLDGMQQGTETLYFDQWGAREARYTNATLRLGKGVERKVSRLILTNKEWVYTIDFLEKTGIKTRNPAYDKKQAATNLNVRDLSRINAQKLYKLGGKKIGTEQVADLPCEVWEVKRLAAKFWIWKQLVLKRQPKIATERTIIREAIIVSTGNTIPDDKFAIPKDIKIKDLSKESLMN